MALEHYTGKIRFILNQKTETRKEGSIKRVVFLMEKDHEGVKNDMKMTEACKKLRKNNGWVLAVPDVIPGPKYCPNSIVEYAGLGNKRPSETLALDARRHLTFLGWKIECAGYKDSTSCFRFRYTSPDGSKVYTSLRLLCCDMRDAAIGNSGSVQDFLPNKGKRKRVSDAEDEADPHPKPRQGKEIRMMRKLRSLEANNQPTRVLRPSKAARPQIEHEVAAPKCSEKAVEPPSEVRDVRNPRTVLSWLIDNNVVKVGDKVHYRGSMKEGRIKREGIECGGCGKLFTLTNFEAHMGSTNRRPAANILLEDGRSLQDCQKHVKPMTRKYSAKGKQERMRRMDENDNICSVCKEGGDLILCDKCPSSFHTSCLGLEDVPEGDWYCFSCCCCICEQIRFKEGVQESEAAACILKCEQCHRRCHAGCVNREAIDKSERENCLKGKIFCSDKCGNIFAGLQKLVGRPITVANDDGDLTWTLVKCSETDISDNSKLNAALEVMHECFEPSKDDYTGRDVVEEIIYGRGCDLTRMNCQGFYSALLEKDGDVTTVANVRIWGDKLAEIPLVATRFQYRRLGMCRILMNELEKQLVRFGVERLVLPSATNTLATWINGFGFTELTKSDRKQFVGISFLDFHGTIMCQKVLQRSTSART